jgi:16S rRNA (guanine527-N7)-methyltransferase
MSMKDGKKRRQAKQAPPGAKAPSAAKAPPAADAEATYGRPTADAILAELGGFAESFKTHTGVEMGRGLREKLATYVIELYKWNDRSALLSKKDEERVVERHVMDSLSLLSFLHETEGTSILDIGSGAGFPAIPLKLAAPGATMALVESVRKKTLFLNYIVGKLGLGGAHVFEDRAENSPWSELAPDGFDTVISRATFSLPDLIPLAVPAVKHGGLLIAYKGGRYEDEMKAAEFALDNTSLKLVTVWQSPWGPGKLLAFQRG